MQAQTVLNSNINLQSSYLFEIPGGDLNDRFGVNNKFEFKLEYLTPHSFGFYLKTGLRLGDVVKEDVLTNLRTQTGNVVGVNGYYADIFGRKRGFDIGIGVDKLIPVSILGTKNHQIRFGLSLVNAHHWIRLIDESKSVPQILGEYQQVYDRYVSGMGVEENLNFQYNSKSKNASFIFGLQFQQIFGKEHRIKFINDSDKANRKDLYFGLKLSYLLPLYSFDKSSTIYY